MFETARLVVRDWEDADAGRTYDMFSRDDVVRYLGTAPAPLTSPEQAVERVARLRVRNAEQAPYGVWAAERRDDGVLVGQLALVPVPDGDGAVEVAWALHPDSWRAGYATEGARGVLDHAARHGIGPVVALTDPANTASQAVCERIGLRLTEVSDRYYGKPLQVWVSPPA